MWSLVADRDPDGVAFDRRWGTETRWFDLGNYEPTPVSVVEAALAAVPIAPATATFVDLGSGKGRVVLLASRRPFQRVVGIERRPRLHAAATRNLAAFTARGGPIAPVELVCGDAAALPVPDGRVVVWLFNPFAGDVLVPVLDRLVGRDVWIVYVVPSHLALVRFRGFDPVATGGAGDYPWVVLTRRGALTSR
ncbi:MAG: class I SAM-dependent methyltransferase [Myxococcota bacterium]